MRISGSEHRSHRLEEDLVSAINYSGWPEFSDLRTMDAVDVVQRAVRYTDSDS